MLKKLLKYDLKSVFKYWWIVAVSSLALCLLGGGCITVLRAERDLPQIVNISAITVIIFAVIGLVAFCLFSTIILFVRFYKNFFTDEGYLTFTLPVKRSSLLNSKLITTVILSVATVFGVGFNTVAMFLIGYFDKIFTYEFWKEISAVCEEIIRELKGYLPIFAIEGIIIALLYVVFAFLFLYNCITFASVITKRARVITAIGVYYGANMIFSFVIQIFALFGAPGLIERISRLSESLHYPIFSVVLLGVILFMAMVCVMLYTLQYWMLDRKLNLA